MCHAWNVRAGPCAARNGDCKFHLKHGYCNVCGKYGHRACDVHGNVEVKGKGKNKGKDKGKGKNKGKDKGKNKDKQD